MRRRRHLVTLGALAGGALWLGAYLATAAPGDRGIPEQRVVASTTTTERPAATTTTEPWDDIDESFYEETADPFAGEPSGPPGPFVDRATGQFWCVHPNSTYVACSEAAYFGGWRYQDPATGEVTLVNRWGLEAVCAMPDGTAAACG